MFLELKQSLRKLSLVVLVLCAAFVLAQLCVVDCLYVATDLYEPGDALYDILLARLHIIHFSRQAFTHVLQPEVETYPFLYVMISKNTQFTGSRPQVHKELKALMHTFNHVNDNYASTAVCLSVLAPSDALQFYISYITYQEAWALTYLCPIALGCGAELDRRFIENIIAHRDSHCKFVSPVLYLFVL